MESPGSYKKFDRINIADVTAQLEQINFAINDFSQLMLEIDVISNGFSEFSKLKNLKKVLIESKSNFLEFQVIDLALEQLLTEIKFELVNNEKEPDFEKTSNQIFSQLEILLSAISELYLLVGRQEEFIHLLIPTRLGVVTVNDFIQQMKVTYGLAKYTKTLVPKYDRNLPQTVIPPNSPIHSDIAEPSPGTQETQKDNLSKTPTFSGLGSPNRSDIIQAIGTARSGFSSIEEAAKTAVETIHILERNDDLRRTQSFESVAIPTVPNVVPQEAQPDSSRPTQIPDLEPVKPTGIIDQAGLKHGYFTPKFIEEVGQVVKIPELPLPSPSPQLTALQISRNEDTKIIVREKPTPPSKFERLTINIEILRRRIKRRTREIITFTIAASASASAWAVYNSNRSPRNLAIPQLSASATNSSHQPTPTEKLPKQPVQPKSIEKKAFQKGIYKVDVNHEKYQDLLTYLKKLKLDGVLSITKDLSSQISFLFIENPDLAATLTFQGKLVFTGNETEVEMRNAVFKQFLILSQSEKVNHQWVKNTYFKEIKDQYEVFVLTKKWPEKSEAAQLYYQAFQKPLKFNQEPEVKGYAADITSLEKPEFRELKRVLPGFYSMYLDIVKDQEKSPVQINDFNTIKADICDRVKKISRTDKDPDKRSGASYVYQSACGPKSISGNRNYLNAILQFTRPIKVSNSLDTPIKPDQEEIKPPITPIHNNIISKPILETITPEETTKKSAPILLKPNTTISDQPTEKREVIEPIASPKNVYQLFAEKTESEKHQLFDKVFAKVAAKRAANTNQSKILTHNNKELIRAA